ncbi:MAG: HpcH/HpaI aldolase/citrate lyase family protein [Methylovirgula sp.]
MAARPRRSVLCLPGADANAHEAAKVLDADVLIFDLSDAVAPDDKAAARAATMTSLRAGGYGGRETVVRINGHMTPWYKEDVMAVAACTPDAVLIPKVASPGDVMRVAKDLREAGAQDHVKLWAMLETPLAVLNADSILRTAGDPASRLCVVVIGTQDLARECRAALKPGRAAIVAHLTLFIAAARAYAVEIIDGIYADIGNAEGLRAECEQGCDLGMDGKLLIHPDQITLCNEIFALPKDDVVKIGGASL